MSDKRKRTIHEGSNNGVGEIRRIDNSSTLSSPPVDENSMEPPIIGEPQIVVPTIGKKELQKANSILRKYKAGKQKLESRIIENEQWWKLRHWEYIDHEDQEARENPIKPRSAWLFNTIMSKHADGIEAYPEPNILPREESDKQEAQALTSIIPVILQQNEFEETYNDELWQKLKGGTGVYGVFWDPSKLNGLGDICIKKVDILNLFWEPGVTNIQKSRNFFNVELVDNEVLREMYPQLEGKINGRNHSISQYVYDDNVDTTDKSLVVDWYYKRKRGNKTVLHYCKYVGSTVLYASENDTEHPSIDAIHPVTGLPVKIDTGKPSIAERGWYDHGLYPFVFDPLFPVEGSPCGFGYIDVCKSPQTQIDMLNQAITMNAMMSSIPRYFSRSDGGINEEEFADWTKPIVHVNASSFDENSLRQITTNPISPINVQILNNKIEELKHTSGNQDVANGGAPSGITAASAIAALQETAGKSSRDSTKASYRAYRKIIAMVIELIRQFYDAPRKFRITGNAGEESFTTFDNQKMQLQHQGTEYGVDMGYRLPVYDIEVSAQKQTAYTKLAQNELALQFYGNGFFNPQLTDQALACLDMMDFARKENVVQRIQQNGTMYQQLQMYQQLALMYAQKFDPERAPILMQQIGGGQPIIGGAVNSSIHTGEAAEHSRVQNARQGAQESTQPEE